MTTRDLRVARLFGQAAVDADGRPIGRVHDVRLRRDGPIIPGLPDILGYVDLVVETDTELIVSDWKTSRSRWSAEQAEEAADQLLLYSELARDFAPGKRLFLMAPLHYHFEMKEWSETKIIARFWIVTAIFCGAGFALFYRYWPTIKPH